MRLARQDGILVLLDDGAGLAQLGADALEVLGDHVFDQHFAPGRGGRHHIGPGLDLVGDDGIGAAVQLLDAVDLHGVGAGSADVRAHGVEEVRQIHDMRLARRVFDDRAAAGRDGGEDDVHRRADGDLVKIDARAAQAAVRRLRDHEAAAHVDIGAERRHALDVLFDGTNAEIAAAGHGRLGPAEAPEHRADQIVGRTDLSGQIVGRIHAARGGAVDLDRRAVDESDLRAEVAEDGQQHIRVADLRYILDTADAVDQKRRGDDGDRRVLRAADLHFAAQGRAAVDNVFFHVHAPFQQSGLGPILDIII